MLKFNNRENECVNTEDGRKVWLSRSCAVAVTTIWMKDGNGKPEVLLVKRDENAYPEPNKYCLPCGYLDYDENLEQAAVRELYEETGVDVKALNGMKLPWSISGQPWLINSEPESDALQNVTSYYGWIFSYNEKPNLVPQDGELDQAILVPVEKLDEYEIAFNHAQRIRQFVHLMTYGELNLEIK